MTDDATLTKRSLTRKYLSALTLIAFLSLTAFLIISSLIETHNSSGSIVNASGRRRYASQRIVLFATLIVTEKSAEELRHNREGLSAAIQVMETNHSGLINGDSKLNLPGKSSQEINDIYFRKPIDLHRRLLNYISAAKRLLSTMDENLTSVNADYQFILKHGTSDILSDLETVVNLYQKDGDQEIYRLRWLQFLIFLLTLALLLIETLYIFQPMAREIEKRIRDAQTSFERVESQVQERTRELAEAHQQLEFQRAKSLESARLASLGEMSGGIAHEINTPLATITTRSAQIKRLLKQDPQTNSKSIELVEIIESVTKIIAKIVQGLRNISRSADNDSFSLTPIKTIIDNVVSLCSERLRSNGIELCVEIEDSSLAIQCRAVQISQVILNLINNADHAVNSATEKWVNISVQDLGDDIQIAVTDSGHGVSEDVREKLFQPFFTTKDIGKGTGLGLSISRSIVESHNGKISIDLSSSNTKFVMELPKRYVEASGPKVA